MPGILLWITLLHHYTAADNNHSSEDKTLQASEVKIKKSKMDIDAWDRLQCEELSEKKDLMFMLNVWKMKITKVFKVFI